VAYAGIYIGGRLTSKAPQSPSGAEIETPKASRRRRGEKNGEGPSRLESLERVVSSPVEPKMGFGAF